MNRSIWPAIAAVALLTAPAYAQSDFQMTFNNINETSYQLTAVSSPLIYAGTLPAADPTIRMAVYKRYAITVVNGTTHPIQIVGLGATSAQDALLLAMGTTAGSLEGDTAIDFEENATGAQVTITFTMTPSLADAMAASGRTPGYRCGVHPAEMRGAMEIFGQALLDPVPEAIAPGIRVNRSIVATDLVSPIGVRFSQSGTEQRMYVIDQVGVVWLYINGTRQATPFLDVQDRLVELDTAYDERGLLGFALHPNFNVNGIVFTYTSEPVSGDADFTVPMMAAFDHQSVISEWIVSDSNPNAVNPASRREIMRVDQPQANDNAGTLRFNLEDNFLYISLGDGGNALDRGPGHVAGGNAQDLSLVYGKILRIDPDYNNTTGTLSANGQYRIPADNPFVLNPPDDPNALLEIYAYGLRNPFLFSFDPETGDLWLGDAGQNFVEEVDLIVPGGNYGWPIKEGNSFINVREGDDYYLTAEPVQDVPDNLIDPIAEYDHNEGTVVIGGFVYLEQEIPALFGLYVFGDLGFNTAAPNGRLFYLDETDTIRFLRFPTDTQIWVKGFGQDDAGEIYYAGSKELGPTGATGEVWQLEAGEGEGEGEEGEGEEGEGEEGEGEGEPPRACFGIIGPPNINSSDLLFVLAAPLTFMLARALRRKQEQTAASA